MNYHYRYDQDLEARLDKHEAICSERYKMLAEILQQNREELKALRQVASMGAGAWKAIIAVGTLLTIIWTIIRITTNR